MAQAKTTENKTSTTAAVAATPVVEKEVAKAPDKNETIKKVTVKKEPASKEVEKKESVKKVSTKKASAKKAPVQKTQAKKAEIASTITIELDDQTIVARDVLTKVKSAWTTQFKGKLKDIETLDVYIKPYDHRAYFVVNGDANENYFVEL